MLDGTWRRLALAVIVGIGSLGQGSGPAHGDGYWPAALGGTSTTPLMRTFAGGSLRGPAGWEVWCAGEPEACDRDAPAVIALDGATVATLERVFHSVHERIIPEEEPAGQDVWQVVEGHGFGDCEDYALTWREELVRAGLPRGALDIAVAETEQGEIHAVLAIHTDHGTIVFDNRHKTPKLWASLPYAWLALEPITTGLAAWQSLPDHHRIGTTPTVTAEGRAQR
jgi:predicted transglutaminase-like cysteine proteinase